MSEKRKEKERAEFVTKEPISWNDECAEASIDDAVMANAKAMVQLEMPDECEMGYRFMMRLNSKVLELSRKKQFA